LALDDRCRGSAPKSPYAAPNHRNSIAEALTDATEAMFVSAEPPSAVAEIRRPDL
jgi:hypothetical protein